MSALGRSDGTTQKISTAVQRVVVAFRMLASPLLISVSPQAMAIHGTTELVTAMNANEPTRPRHP